MPLITEKTMLDSYIDTLETSLEKAIYKLW